MDGLHKKTVTFAGMTDMNCSRMGRLLVMLLLLVFHFTRFSRRLPNSLVDTVREDNECHVNTYDRKVLNFGDKKRVRNQI